MTGSLSLLSNLMILETMLSSDFFSDLSLLRYKFFGVNGHRGVYSHNVAVRIEDLCNVLGLEKLFYS